MSDPQSIRIAIVYPGDLEARLAATADNNRFTPLFHELAARGGVIAEPVVYHPDFADAVYQQLLQVDGVLVWVNPIQDGHDRAVVLDALLKKVAGAGVFVSTHPDIILKMGTKEVLYQTRHMGWGSSDTQLYNTLEELRRELPLLLATGQVRVLKQNRGHSGGGVWKIQAVEPVAFANPALVAEASVRVRHAERGSIEQVMSFSDFLVICETYFAGAGKMINQVYQPRLPEGMIRCYLVHNQVAGFGHQAINALYPAPEGGSPADSPQPGPRLYHPPDLPAFQALKRQLEQEWVPELQSLLGIPTVQLPILWDADFLLGTKQGSGDTYVLCEINVSSVAPYPDSATSVIAEAVIERTRLAKELRQASTENL
jgi:hypothetical protein